MSTNAPKASSVNLDDADRAASVIRPSWELDEAEFEAPAEASAPAKLVEAASKIAQGGTNPEIAKSPGSFGTTTDIPRDTVIDGVPTVTVGRTIDIGPAADEPVRTKPERAPPPPKPQATRFGLGSDPGPEPEGDAVAMALAATEVARPPVSAPPAAPSSAPPPESGEVLSSASAPPPPRARSSSPPPADAPQPVQPMGASFSRADDPIEIPVQKGKGLYIVGGAVALAAIVGAVIFWSGSKGADTSSTSAPADTATAKPTSGDSKPTAAATTAPAPKETAAAPDTATSPTATSPTATAAATTTAAPEKTATPAPPPTHVAVSEPPPPPPSKPPPPASKPPPSKPPPSKPGGGGIIHETPF